jgi:putative redox protein
MVKIVVTQLPKMRQKSEIGQQLVLTDQPASWGGLEENGSPTDLFAAALAACMLTMMAFEARKQKVSVDGAQIEIEKELSSDKPLRITVIRVQVKVPGQISPAIQKVLEEAASHCPVHQSLHPDVDVQTTFIWSM